MRATIQSFKQFESGEFTLYRNLKNQVKIDRNYN